MVSSISPGVEAAASMVVLSQARTGPLSMAIRAAPDATTLTIDSSASEKRATLPVSCQARSLIASTVTPTATLTGWRIEAILSAVPIESIQTMMYETSGPYALTEDPPVWAQYKRTIAAAGLSLQLEPIEKWDFYEKVATNDHVLTVQTADQQRYANILLHVGVRMD